MNLDRLAARVVKKKKNYLAFFHQKEAFFWGEGVGKNLKAHIRPPIKAIFQTGADLSLDLIRKKNVST